MGCSQSPAEVRHADSRGCDTARAGSCRIPSVQTGRCTRQCAPHKEMKMTINDSATQNDTPTTPTTPTAGDTSPYAEAAAQIQQALDTIAAEIPAVPLTLQSTRTDIRRRQGTNP